MKGAAFREVGRVIRTAQLLRFLSDPQLRRRTIAAVVDAGAGAGVRIQPRQPLDQRLHASGITDRRAPSGA